jgi:UDP-N-acetylglucosamine:LPS N-acetylglucosamine transferase
VILLVSSSGGCFNNLLQLRPFWSLHERLWITPRTPMAEEALAGERVAWSFSPTTRNLPNLLRNLLLALRLLLQERPTLVLSTGAGVAVPFLVLGRLMGARTVFIESVSRVTSLSLSARLVRPFLTVLYVHWPELQRRYPQAELIVGAWQP